MIQWFKNGIARLRDRNPVAWIIVFYIVGFIGLLFPFSRSIFLALVPFTLLLSGLLVLIYHGPISKNDWWKFLAVYMFGFLAEVAGVNSGVIFGEYSYGETLGLKLFGTPLIIGLNWFMLIYAVNVITAGFTPSLYFRAVIGAVAMVAYDFILEPAAIRLDMWSWDLISVPLQNFIAWLLLSFILNLFAGYTGLVNTSNRVAKSLFFIQLGFFLALDIAITLGKLWEY